MTGQMTCVKYRTVERFILCLMVALSIVNIKASIPFVGEIPVNRVLVILAILWRIQCGNRFKNDKIYQITIICWSIFLFAGMLTLIWTVDIVTASTRWIDFIFLALIVVMVLDYTRDEGDLRAVLAIYTGCAVVLAILGIYENITGNHFHLTYVSYAVRNNLLGFFPANTVFYNTNDMSSFVVAAIPIVFMWSELYTKPLVLKMLFGLPLALSVIFNLSRGAVLALILFAILVLVVRRKSSINALVLLFGTVLFLILSEILAATSLGQFLLEDGDSGRYAIWANTLNNLKDSAFLGVGPGCAAVVNATDQLVSTSVYAVHNYFLQVVAEFGVIGFASLMVWFGHLYMRIQWNRTYLARKWLKVSDYELLALLVFVVISISSSDMTSKSWLYVWFVILLAATKILPQNVGSKRKPLLMQEENGEDQ